ncbi:MAG: hypothetical protein BGO39_00510 [Chloroflexi bacterium 54-19]|nr:MAG: hypothetical protein BGO39_00510 [Chloroflexi bacterium 54-19]
MDRTIATTPTLAGQYTAVFEALTEIGREYTSGGQPGAACALFEKARQLFEPGAVPAPARLKLLTGYARSLVTNLFVNHSGEETLAAVLGEARSLAESSSDRLALAEVLNLLGQTDYFISIFGGFVSDKEKAHYGPALAYQEQALAIRQELEDLEGICESNFFVGLVHERWQERETARTHYNFARELAEQHHFYFQIAETSRHLAGIALAEGDLDAALANSLRELRGREQAGFKPYLPLDHLLLCDIYLLRGELEKALAHAQAALALAEEMDYAGAGVLSRLRFGDIKLKQGEREEAVAEYSRALETAQKLGQALLLNYANQRLAQAGVSRE